MTNKSFVFMCWKARFSLSTLPLLQWWPIVISSGNRPCSTPLLCLKPILILLKYSQINDLVSWVGMGCVVKIAKRKSNYRWHSDFFLKWFEPALFSTVKQTNNSWNKENHARLIKYATKISFIKTACFKSSSIEKKIEKVWKKENLSNFVWYKETLVYDQFYKLQ